MNQKEIALEIGVHPSTISREIRRNNDKVRGYSAETTQIARRMKLDTGVSVVHETIYRSRGTIIDRIMIEKRANIVEKYRLLLMHL